MRLLRRTRYLASIGMLTTAIAVSAYAAQSRTSKTSRETQAGKRPGTTSTRVAPRPAQTQKPIQPPVNVTVTLPQPTPEQLNAERQEREREMAIHEQLSRFTGWLALIGGMQVVASGVAFFLVWRAANAARESADVARATLQLTEGADVQFFELIAPYPLTNDTRITLRFRNYGRTRALRARLVWTHWLNSPDGINLAPIPGTHIVPANGDITVSSETSIGQQTGDRCVDIITGMLAYGFKVAVYYEDVFDTAWTRFYEGTFVPGHGWVQEVTSESKTPVRTSMLAETSNSWQMTHRDRAS